MAFTKILIALDRTPRADKVFEQGIDIAKRHQASVFLLHCITGFDTALAGDAMKPSGVAYPWPSAMVPTTSAPTIASSAEFAGQQEAQIARDWLMQYQQKALDAGCYQVDFDVSTGKAGDRICEAAKALEADLVVVGRRDRSGIEEFLLGSVSNNVAHNAPSAVLLVPE